MAQRMNLWSRPSHTTTDVAEHEKQTTSTHPFRFRHTKRQTDQTKMTEAANNLTEGPNNAKQPQTNPSKMNPVSTEVEKKTVGLDPNAKADEPIDMLEIDMRRKPYRRVSEKKARRRAMSVSVSAEEERILRQHVADMNRSFSEWARSVMFRALGRKVPSRGYDPSSSS